MNYQFHWMERERRDMVRIGSVRTVRIFWNVISPPPPPSHSKARKQTYALQLFSCIIDSINIHLWFYIVNYSNQIEKKFNIHFSTILVVLLFFSLFIVKHHFCRLWKIHFSPRSFYPSQIICLYSMHVQCIYEKKKFCFSYQIIGIYLNHCLFENYILGQIFKKEAK